MFFSILEVNVDFIFLFFYFLFFISLFLSFVSDIWLRSYRSQTCHSHFFFDRLITRRFNWIRLKTEFHHWFFCVRYLTLLFSTRFSTFCVYCWVDFIDFFLGKILQRILYNFLSKKIHPYAIKTGTLNYDKLQTKKTDKKNSPKQWKIVSSSIKIMK